ncbi:MAG TPA: 4'-phosphopantetheinyl transferase superfamily protein [Casimicrobiaceae bacterium]|nr:4'-phosphopantetheinyl transferase superfamily protein [Casimicrobiaceae bacterium]
MNELAFARISPRDAIDTKRSGDLHVDVWACTLRGHADEIEAWHDDLSIEERERAARFVRPHDRDRHVIAHGILRHVLARYRGVAPRELRFAHASHGKPALVSGGSGPRIGFNLSHAGDAALIAIAENVEVGVDLERERDNLDVAGIAGRFFHGRERVAILEAANPARAFFRHWVAKEAVLKAHGSGFALALDAFAIDFEGEDAASVVAPSLPDLERSHWRIHMLRVPRGWQAAVCVPQGFSIRVRTPAVGAPAF